MAVWKFTLVPCLVLATATAIASALPHQRLQRDVSELVAAQQPAYNYLPPEPKLALPEEITATTEAIIAETETPVANEEPEPLPESAVLGADGYEYRAVRRLKYRQRVRRDVSHLSPSYLPPSQSYLPPNADDTIELNAAVPKVAPVYLPPPAEEVSTEAPIVVEEVETEPAAVPEEESQQQQEEHVQPEVRSQEGEEEAPQDSGILMDDGYHYKQPAEEMALPKAVDSEYLPPLEQGQTEAEGPEEAAVLAKDGYHYRAIKRLRL
ncbi:translation initiation factor IF-2 [Bactrocera neohumeralis]|uniref:translation initiation factor IF-2 n=1 Tax=Bactrocera neohumeralis TaxID=98809 RepID=UPI00216676A2|nr:translation initiation factor IF-2 [Bactrocera neohumeralis]